MTTNTVSEPFDMSEGFSWGHDWFGIQFFT